ncbi:putative oligosaccharyl transferase, STT3 subunit 2 [Thermococcus cleftensis]|uniref:dolichyl-phosphooligosaccharide-protein glycotransferase n=2 Tax=Thermococcus cleftensis (strain DSM 27260 / KACC 17922 / CL1) TaxID=163003 RepID=I3ZTN0_THECF|nr:putative oligosaccharyl transferase, STT3 subunit 2 [Thermococcus cleftensis]
MDKLTGLMKTKYILPVLVITALILRLIPLRLKYFLGYDTYFHAAYVEYSATMGKWVNFFPYANAPWGMLIDQFHPKGFWITPFYLYKLLSPLGLSIDEAFRVTPAVVGTATVVLIYFAIKSLYGEREAGLSAIFLAISFGHIFRSMANYYRGDNYLLLWYALALLGIGLALSPKIKGEPGDRRLVFYLIPGLVAGLAAGFWSAYYLIFVFLLANAAFLTLEALILQEDWAFADSISLTAAAAAGALMANFLGARVGYGMFGWNRPDGMAVAEKLGLEFGLVKDAFLLAYLKYAVPLLILATVVLLAASRLLKDPRSRISLIVVLLLGVAAVGVHYRGLVEETFLAFLQRFGDGAIAETQRTSLRDVWISYGTLLLAVPFFTLRLRPSRARAADFIVLSFAIPGFIMMALWARFLFIGSLAVAVLAGIGAVELIEFLEEMRAVPKKHAAAALIVLLTVPTGILDLQNTLNARPFVDENWERALVKLGELSNGNDVVLTWWDQGYWVTYFSHRATPSKGVPDELTARYYLGMVSKDELMNLGVDYVIVSYDTVLKFPAVLETAGVPPKDYPMVPIPLVEQVGGAFLFEREGYSISAKPRGDHWEVVVAVGESRFSPKKAFVEDAAGVRGMNVTGAQKADAYVYLNLNYGYAVLMNGRAFNTTLARLMFTERAPNYRLVYSDGGYIKIFRFEHPNVAVVSREGKIILEFTNATGTYLTITGFLDNGRVVFDRRYKVEKADEFYLPDQLNGSVVIRYTYWGNGKVLDRGTFRLDDTWQQ